MTANEIRKKYIDFFIKKGHKEIPPAPLVPSEDPTTLFTNSGMQQLVPYLKGKQHPMGKRLVDSQPCFRAEDIEEIGDNRHTTFFEMLGNWSLGDYFKKDQLTWFFEFLTKEVGLDSEKLYATVFKGNKQVPKDKESIKLWQELFKTKEPAKSGKKGFDPKVKIYSYDATKNWWSRAGVPANMPVGEIGGPDSEVFYDFETPHDPKFGKVCHVNCDCGRFLEIGNSVFMQYEKQKDGSFKPLPDQNVDFGGGLERIAATSQNKPEIFQMDLFVDLKNSLTRKMKLKLNQTREQRVRIFLDHSRAAIFFIATGLKPGKNRKESVLRRLIRRADDQLTILKIDNEFNWKEAVTHYKKYYKGVYSDSWNSDDIFGVIIKELRKYGTVFKKLEEEKQKLIEIRENKPSISLASAAAGPVIFHYQSTFGVPGTASEVLVNEVGLDSNITMESYKKEMNKHRELSKTTSAGMFKGGLEDQSEATTKLHTATHLLHKALRTILGEHVQQEGSNITAQRLRFDFTHPQALSDDQIKKIENLINQKIEENLPVHKTIENKDKALKSGALAFFKETYPKKVSVYTIGKDFKKDWFSKELCGGPHVKSTGEIGKIKITREKSIGSGMRRIYAKLPQQRSRLS